MRVNDYLHMIWTMEPVRAIMYTVLTSVITILGVKYAFLDGDTRDLIDAVVAAVLGIPATALMRSQVDPKAMRGSRPG